MTRAQKQSAYVLHTRPYKESSVLADVLSREQGRLTLVAKGARRLKSPYRGLLRPFQPLQIGWSGRGELAVLTQADPQANAYRLQGAAIWCGFYLNELLVRLLHRHDAHPRLYDAYETGLESLATGAGLEAALRIFEKRLLQELGYALNLCTEAETGAPIKSDGRYTYFMQRGAVLSVAEDTESFSGDTLLDLDRELFTNERTLRESKNLMRAVISHYLGGRRLHSRRGFAAIDKTKANGS